jgi:cytochrome c peroxidase
MKKRFFIGIIFIGFLSMAFNLYDYTCIILPENQLNYEKIEFPLDVLNNLSEMDNMPEENPTTDDGALLGRVLFYDVDLSKNNTISCASCHIQKYSFADTAQFSKGFSGKLGTRNSMGLIHARFQKDSSFFWDNRATTLEIQTLMPIQDSIEMGLNLDTLLERVSSKSFYPTLFKNAFGSENITTERISMALAQFIRSMNTFGSKFRQGVNITKGNPSITPFSNFTEQENLGKELFMDEFRGNCQACHTRNIMVQGGAQNIGLDLVYKDNGQGALTGKPNSVQNGKFSVPSLINVELTAPYMHDGRFKTLEEVINFYSDSIKNHVNLSGFLREIQPGNTDPNHVFCDTCPPRKPHFTNKEKAALVAFLKTLTDTLITNDQRWSNPFCRNEINGINEINPIFTLNIFPNPIDCGTTNLNINSESAFESEVIINNLSGKLVFKSKYNFTIGQNTIDIKNELVSGIYLVSILDKNKNKITKKLIVK